jgi:protein TonB
MKTLAWFVLLFAISAPGLLAQAKTSSAAPPQPYEIQISSVVAEKLLVHKVEPDACPHVAMAARVTGTVVVAFEIDQKGNVLHLKVVSGPKMLQKAVFDAVRKYKYNPYLLNGKAVEVETTVSVAIDTLHGCPGE